MTSWRGLLPFIHAYIFSSFFMPFTCLYIFAFIFSENCWNGCAWVSEFHVEYDYLTLLLLSKSFFFCTHLNTSLSPVHCYLCSVYVVFYVFFLPSSSLLLLILSLCAQQSKKGGEMVKGGNKAMSWSKLQMHSLFARNHFPYFIFNWLGAQFEIGKMFSLSLCHPAIH